MTYFVLKLPEKYPEKPLEVHLRYNEKKSIPYDDFQSLKSLCGREYSLWQTVSVRLENEDFIMLVEEEGKIKNFGINKLATLIYSNPYDVIVGDVWLCKFDGIEDLAYLDEVEVGMIKADLLRRFRVKLTDYVMFDPDDGDASEEILRHKYYRHYDF